MRFLVLGLALTALFTIVVVRTVQSHITSAVANNRTLRPTSSLALTSDRDERNEANAPRKSVGPVARASTPATGNGAHTRYEEFVRQAHLEPQMRRALEAALVEMGHLLERGPRLPSDEGQQSTYYFAVLQRTLSQIERTLPPSAVPLFHAQVAPVLPELVQSHTGRAPASDSDEELSFDEIYAEFMRQFSHPSQ